MKKTTSIVILLSMLFLNACAFDVIRVQQKAVTIKPTTAQDLAFTLKQDAEVSLATGYKRKLKAKTRWVCIGSLPQGEVYKSADQILTVEGSNIFEANIVVASNKLVGFYLPVEGTYSSLKKPLALQITQ